jgi:2-polyprenyl-3-methyl-5-hydroxy-6-metoxy-1,4-benzoquinol methylase
MIEEKKYTLNNLKEIPQNANVCVFGDDELTSESSRFIKRHRADVNIDEKSGKRLMTLLANGEDPFTETGEISFCNFVILCTGEIDLLESAVKKAKIKDYKIFDYGIFEKKINWFHILFKFTPMLILVCLLWLIQVILLSPFLAIARFWPAPKNNINKMRGDAFDKTRINKKKIAIKKGKYNRLFGIVSRDIPDFDQLTYISRVVYGCANKLDEISSLYGSPLSEYGPARWSIFKDALKDIATVETRGTLRVLDLGAGCFKETYELTKLGFKVDAVQLDQQVVDTYMTYYDWEKLSTRPDLITSSIDKIQSEKKYNLITAFDVLEHVLTLEDHLNTIWHLLIEDGCFLVSVPNKKSLGETIWHKKHLELCKTNAVDKTGKSHVHFFTPEEWELLFEKHGFKIMVHEMGLGFVGYDLFFTLYNMISQVFFEFPVRRLTKFCNIKYIPNSFEKIFYPAWLLNLACRLDILLKPFFYDRWGTNLFVLKKQNHKG